ncbi:IS200/IS605 family transposase [Sutterella wadsworthensis]|uniref:IS200/IS605 family transposase n=1 Tax=Sutterella wadsworthensis TaxID=40545 RepID=UPI003966AACF
MREFSGKRNRVYLLVSCPPNAAVSSLVIRLKGVTSRKLGIRFPEQEASYCKRHQRPPFCAATGCGEAPLEMLKVYIENQNQPA